MMIKQYAVALGMIALSGTTCLAGYSFSLPSFKGGGTVSLPTSGIAIVDFWASWCAPCKASFAHYNTLAAKGIHIIGINQDKDKKEGEKFLSSTPANFSLAWDEGGKVYSAYGVGSMPTAYLFNNGSLVKTFPGFNSGTPKEMEAEIEKTKGKK